MSFYLTLPSNSPSHVENTQSDFTTFLCDTIRLEKNYEVALAEINISSNFDIDLGTITVRHTDYIKYFPNDLVLSIQIPNNLSVQDLVNRINAKMTIEYKFVEYMKLKTSPDFLADSDFLTDSFGDIKKNFIDNSSNMSVENYFQYIYNRIELSDHKIYITEKSGLFNNIFDPRFTNNYSRLLPTTLNLINFIVIYTDIIDHQYFGDIKTQILRTIPIRYNNNNIQTLFDNHQYVKVKNSVINSINIQLRDIWGNPIHFSDFFSYVVVNLHFRPIN